MLLAKLRHGCESKGNYGKFVSLIYSALTVAVE